MGSLSCKLVTEIMLIFGSKDGYGYLFLKLTKTQWQIPKSWWARIGSIWASGLGVGYCIKFVFLELFIASGFFGSCQCCWKRKDKRTFIG